jgi:predicted transcriptional regulator
MVRYVRRVTIVKVDKPSKITINEEIQWFSTSLGLFGERDKEKSKFRIFLELLKAAKTNKGLSTDQISDKTNLTRATVMHHLDILMEQGLVINKDAKYYLRLKNLEELTKALHQDVQDIFIELNKIAESIDKELGLK